MSYSVCPDKVKQLVDKIIDVEGGFVDNENDSGGATKYGITEDTARNYGYTGLMEDLPLATARCIYTEEYFYNTNINLIYEADSRIGYEVLDSAVNVGSSRAVTWLQVALNAFNNKESFYEDISEDGLMGRNTLRALNAYLSKRRSLGVEVMLKALNCQQGSFYLNLAKHRVKDEEFVFGWINQRVSL